MKINFKNKFNNLASLLVLFSPLFFLTIRHWTNLLVLFLFFYCLFLLAVNKKTILAPSPFAAWTILICAMFFAHLAAIAISQLIRLDFYPPNWDGPLRLAMCIPVFLAIANGGLKTNLRQSTTRHWLTFILPLSLLWTFFIRINYANSWGSLNISTYFVDPLSFGSFTLLFSLLTLLGLSEYWTKLCSTQKCLCVFGILAGIYMSLKSGSRTGWMSLPFFLVIWAQFSLKPQFGIKKTIYWIVAFLSIVFFWIASQQALVDKFILGFKEISNYKLFEVNEDTSVNLRLSFYRMGATYFLERPFSGWGDTSWMVKMNRPEFALFASDYARKSPMHGFHNEFVTNSVRSGIWGLIASISFFGIVLLRAVKGIRLKNTGEHRVISLGILIFISHLLIASLTTEINNLVFLSSFNGLTLAVLLGEQIYLEKKIQGFRVKL